MPDQPVHDEFGKPLADGEKLSDEVFNERYGTYEELVVEPSAENPAKQFDPQPFANLK